MKPTPFIILCALLLVACGKKKETTIINTEKKDTTQHEPVIVDVKLKDPPQIEEDTNTTIELNNMTLTFTEVTFYEEENDPIKKEADTIHLVQELGADIQGKLLTIQTNQLTNLTVEQKFETSASLSFEGPHCDMVDWKHYTSPWKKLKQNTSGDFMLDTVSVKDSERFPKVTENEFKTAIIKYCGKEALESFEGKLDVHTYPSWVGVGRIFIRICGIEKSTKKNLTKLLVILTPMGC